MDVFTGQLLGFFCLFIFPERPFPKTSTDRTRNRNASPKIGYIYGGSSLILTLLSVFTWPGGMLLLWPASSLAIISIAYLDMGPALFQKRDGLHSTSARVLLAPYRWIAELTAWYFNRGSADYVSVSPELHFGQRLSSQTAKALKVKAVLDLTAEYEECETFRQSAYLNVPILDLTCPTLEELDRCVAFIKSQPSCYVHCSLGRGRSGLVIAAYLIGKGMAVETSLTQLKELRPKLHLPRDAKALLEEFTATKELS